MLVPLSWLREFTPYEGTIEKLGNKLTMLGLELEDIINPFAPIADMVVGYVALCKPHPDSDHMSCCKVDIGTGELLDIVCGAPNVAEGQKVAVAPVGAKLPDGTVIKKASLRGQPSCGMICSERELGLTEDHSGILVLPDTLDVGHTLIAALNLDTEVLDLSITPNRADCLSILGIARETAAAFSLPLHVPDLPLILDQKADGITVPVHIADPQGCWLYTGRVITGAQVAPSPLKIRYRLYAVGIRPISNIVDITNYILMECGQPLHSFDLDKLAGGEINVRRAAQGEILVTLDGKKRTLDSEDLCICDQNGPVGLAGVMGGENSEITASTKNIFIESAVFDPSSIRRTARRHHLQSEAAYRFERGIDQKRTIWALDRAASLMASISGGFVRRCFACEEPKPFIPCRIPFDPQKADALLGVDIPRDFQKNTLENLGCAVEEQLADTEWIVIQPSWRPDLTRSADIVEEVGRVWGLDAIEPTLPTVKRQLDDNLAPYGPWHFWQLVKNWAANLGLNEVINYSFVGQKDLDILKLPQDNRIPVMNPLSEDQNVLRTVLLPGLLNDLQNNLAHAAQSTKLFELANIFEKDASSQTGARETGHLAILLHGSLHARPWPPAQAELGYAELKGIIEDMASYFHLPQLKFREISDHPYLLPAIAISAGTIDCGHCGRVKPEIATQYNAQKPVWYAELDLSTLHTLYKEATVAFHPLPIYPGVRRDITVSAKNGIYADAILEKILLQRIPILEGAILADCYEHPDGAGRNLTFRLSFRHPDRTLKDAEADREREKIAQMLVKELGVTL